MEFDLRELQLMQLEILRELKRVCTGNNLEFFLAFGSALGAERHQGFIPWDDDIDVFMHVEQLEKLEMLCQTQLKSDFFFQSMRTDKEYGLMIARIRYNNSTLIESPEKDRDINHGAYIDIYPLFNCADNWIGFNLQWITSSVYRLLLYERAPVNHGLLPHIVGKCILWFLRIADRGRLLKFLFDRLKKYPASGLCSTFYGSVTDSRKKYRTEWFSKSRLTAFEDDMMPVSIHNDEYLEVEYGDYMRLPDVEDRKIHHSFEFIDLKKPYSYYKGVKYLTGGEK